MKDVIKLIIGVLLVGLSACVVTDADLASSAALVAIDVTASSDQVAARRSQVSGTITLGYTSSQRVRIRILDNSVPVFDASMDALQHTINLDETIPLLDEGVNQLIVEASYNGQTIEQKLEVVVPAALQAFSVMPSATAVNVYSVDVSGTVEFGYLSAEPAIVELYVEGALAYEQTVDVSTELSADINTTISLSREGTNEIVAKVRYAGHSLTSAFVVTVALDAPTLTFPTWQQAFTPGVGMLVSGDVQLVVDPAYVVDSVDFAVDGGEWLPATDLGGSAYGISIVDPDIADSLVAVRVVISSDAHPLETQFFDTVTVDPVFNCGSSASMLPSNDMISNNKFENRMMVGYFGDPAGGHDVSFVINANVPGDGPFVVVGATQNYGRLSMNTQFNVDKLECNNATCTLPYSLTAYVDGQQLCSQANFGSITRY